MLKQTDIAGLSVLKGSATFATGEPNRMIGDMEALLIKTMGLSNKRKMNFQRRPGWRQVKLVEVRNYLGKLG